jgi:hypothetical protein
MEHVRQTNGNALRNGGALQVTDQHGKVPAALVLAKPSMGVGIDSVTDIIQASRMKLESVMADISSTLKDCDAEMNATEKINIVFEEGRTLFSIERSVSMGQEKRKW